MTKTTIHAQVHRFHDKVALHVGGKTVYLRPEDALKLERAIWYVRHSCRTQPDFATSTVGTYAFEFEGEQ